MSKAHAIMREIQLKIAEMLFLVISLYKNSVEENGEKSQTDAVVTPIEHTSPVRRIICKYKGKPEETEIEQPYLEETDKQFKHPGKGSILEIPNDVGVLNFEAGQTKPDELARLKMLKKGNEQVSKKPAEKQPNGTMKSIGVSQPAEEPFSSPTVSNKYSEPEMGIFSTAPSSNRTKLLQSLIVLRGKQRVPFKARNNASFSQPTVWKPTATSSGIKRKYSSEDSGPKSKQTRLEKELIYAAEDNENVLVDLSRSHYGAINTEFSSFVISTPDIRTFLGKQAPISFFRLHSGWGLGTTAFFKHGVCVGSITGGLPRFKTQADRQQYEIQQLFGVCNDIRTRFTKGTFGCDCECTCMKCNCCKTKLSLEEPIAGWTSAEVRNSYLIGAVLESHLPRVLQYLAAGADPNWYHQSLFGGNCALWWSYENCNNPERRETRDELEQKIDFTIYEELTKQTYQKPMELLLEAVSLAISRDSELPSAGQAPDIDRRAEYLYR